MNDLGFETQKDSVKGKSTQDLINESQRTAGQSQKQARERTKALLQKISGTSDSPVGKTKISAHNAIKTLNQTLLPRYIMKLEEAAGILTSYETELRDLDRKLQKLSVPVRNSIGGRSLDRALIRVDSTRRKLQAHQEATIDRLVG